MNHSRAIFEVALKQVICFSQNKAWVMWKCAKESTFICPASKIYKFLVLFYQYYALEFSS